jgi:predicted AAA+ superfamily ATPase
LDTFRQTGESLAGRFFSLRLHPLSVREWCAQTGAAADAALTHLLQHGGFPEPFLAVSPSTLKSTWGYLKALFIVFIVRPWHDNIARSVLQAPKVYFYDTGLVEGDDGMRFENRVATALLKHVQWQYDVQGKEAGLHYIRTKDAADVDFVLSEKNSSRTVCNANCRMTNRTGGVNRFALQHPNALASQAVRNLRSAYTLGNIKMCRADAFLDALLA